MNELLKAILIYGVTPLLIAFAYIYLFGEVWSKGKIVLSDIASFFGWAGKRVRRYSVEQEYQGTINSIIHDYNKNFETPILPKCIIEWVTPENQKNILKENEAIICLSFDKKDHNLNFYNATLNFVQTGLITKAKEYLTKSSSKAIDLLTTHIIIRNNRKQVLTIFRQKLNDFDETTKLEFETLTPTNDKGLFLHMLLPEFHYYGELIDTLPPNSDFNIEANGFLTWFKELATREFDERTNLKYVSKNLKVGVILVGKDETWESQGPGAYTKWADYYATENYNSVYVLARGNNGYERATIVTKILTHSKGFDELNKNHKIKCVSTDGNEYIVTCYSLRPNKTTIAYLAWESFKEYFSESKIVPAIIDGVTKGGVVVNVFGLKFEILNPLLSEIEITDARKVFQIEDEIYLNILEFNSDNQHIILSNKGTVSDPKHYIDAVLKESKVYTCVIERVQTDRQGLQIGLKVSNPELKSWVYIPKHKATTSRFLDLNKKFQRGASLNVVIENYNSMTSNFVGSIEHLISPWETNRVSKLNVGDIIKVTIKQLNEFWVTCELEEGLECYFTKQEISWKFEECDISRFNLEDNIEVVIVSIGEDKRRINVSIKRLSKTPELEFFDANKNKIIEIEVSGVTPGKGLVVKYPGGTNTGFIHWFELGWGSVGKFEALYKKGDKIKVVISEFDAEKNSVKFSVKRQFEHQFEEWAEIINENDTVRGKVVGYFENSAHIELNQNGYKVQAFILRKFVSNYRYVETDDLPFYLPIGKIFDFYILEINEDRETISLTRTEYLEQSQQPDYGDKITVQYVKENYAKGFIYSNDIEGWINVPEQNIILGSTIDVIPVSQSTGKFALV